MMGHLSSSNRVDPMTFEKRGTCTCVPMIFLSEFGWSTGKAGHSSGSVTFRNPQRLGGGIFHWTSFRRSFELRCDFLVSGLNVTPFFVSTGIRRRSKDLDTDVKMQK